jgi:hypothetical protein
VEDGLIAQVLGMRILQPEPLVEVEADLESEEDVELAVDSAAYRIVLHLPQIHVAEIVVSSGFLVDSVHLANSGEALAEQPEEVHLPLPMSWIGGKLLSEADDSACAASAAKTVSTTMMHVQKQHSFIVRNFCQYCVSSWQRPNTIRMLRPILWYDSHYLVRDGFYSFKVPPDVASLQKACLALVVLGMNRSSEPEFRAASVVVELIKRNLANFDVWRVHSG